MDLLEIGHRIQEAYGKSVAEGHAAMGAYTAHDVEIVHVPEVAADGASSADKLEERGKSEAAALAKLQARLTIEAVRQAGDDLLILETALTGTLLNGTDFRFPEAMLHTFRDGKIVRTVLVGSTEMFSRLAPVMKELGYASSDWA